MFDDDMLLAALDRSLSGVALSGHAYASCLMHSRALGVCSADAQQGSWLTVQVSQAVSAVFRLSLACLAELLLECLSLCRPVPFAGCWDMCRP